MSLDPGIWEVGRDASFAAHRGFLLYAFLMRALLQCLPS